MISHHAALIYAMVIASAADRDMTDPELRTIGDIVSHLPVFHDYDPAQLPNTTASCADILQTDDGLENVLELIKQSLPAGLRETAYALACDVVAADRFASQEELRLLELLRYKLDIDRLIAAGIERGSRARHAIGPRDQTGTP